MVTVMYVNVTEDILHKAEFGWFLSDKESIHGTSFLFVYICLMAHYRTSHTAEIHSPIKGLCQAASSYKTEKAESVQTKVVYAGVQSK